MSDATDADTCRAHRVTAYAHPDGPVSVTARKAHGPAAAAPAYEEREDGNSEAEVWRRL